MLIQSILNIIANSSYVHYIVGDRSITRNILKEKTGEIEKTEMERRAKEVSKLEGPKETVKVEERRINVRA